MDVTEIDIGIPKLSTSEDGCWNRTWRLTFATSFRSQVAYEVSSQLSDTWINLIVGSISDNEIVITLKSGSEQEYVFYWHNSFRIMLLLDKQLGFIERIEDRQRSHWRRFFFQADHERVLDPYKTQLMIAAKNGDRKAVLEAVEAANQIDEQSFTGKTSLMYAAQYGHLGIADLLLKLGGTVALFESDWTPLQLATMSGSAEIVHLFLHAGAEINRQNCYGETALMWAAARGNTKIVKLLLQHGAWTDLIDKQGSDVNDWAAKLLKNVASRDRYTDMSRLLKEFSA